MVDPYPNETQLEEVKFTLPSSHDDSVYFDQDYYQSNSPHLKYIPSANIMIQIMRACCNAKSPKELWFNEREVAQLKVRYTTELEKKLQLKYQVTVQLK
mgnify:CR=1 FL=1